ncbi:MAG TPA: 2-hydroxyacid dehydrogenase [Nitrospirota bacterium]|nr:2-hydroxyacid dehydrogenase [Nitrospirota bacterium]
MDSHHIVVTYKVREERRELLKNITGERVKLSFLSDMSTGLREQTLVSAEVLFTWNLPKEVGPSELSLLQNVRLVQLLSAGADHIPYKELPANITIASNVGAYAEPMAEHILALILALSKNLVREHQNLGQGNFNQSLLNRRVRGLACGIIGFGGIGRAAARLMRGLGMRIFALNTSGRTDEQVDFIGTLENLRYILTEADVVVISIPLTKATRGLIGKRELEWMKNDSILINVARANIINEAALYYHLISHPDFKAGIDAWWIEPFTYGEFKTDFPFLSLPNVIGSPHNSALVSGINEESTRLAMENVMRFLRGEKIIGVVRREDYI